METKTKLNKTSKFLLRSIVKQSHNDLELSDREKTMIKWFMKFQLALVFLISVIVLFSSNVKIVHTDDFNRLTSQAKEVAVKSVSVAPAKAQQEKQLFKLLDEFEGTVYAYNSFESQTDGDPCTGAFGYICDKKNVVANNCYKKGTVVEILGKKYTVFDRMNERYGCDVFDIYMGMDHDSALEFGKKITNVKILRVNK